MPKTVVITGASRGIGLALAQRFAVRGDTVIAGARAIPAAQDGTLRFEKLDVTSAASVELFCQRLEGRTVDVLVNNAGVIGGDHQSLGDMDYDAWREALEVNTLAPFRMTTALLDHLARAERGKVITLTSQMGSLARKSTGSYAYRSSKAAANKVMQVMAVELQTLGIIACPVHPGWVRTDMGGSDADISVDESADGLVALIDGLTMADSGRFWTWNGQEHPW